jgi:3-oxoacyl-ACP reductase-like protein
LGGVPGWVLSASIAGGTTLAVGGVVMRWFETGTKPNRKQVGKMASIFGKSFRSKLSNLGKKKPSKESVTEALDELMDEKTEEMLDKHLDGEGKKE